MQSIFIPGRFPGLNEMINSARTHWAKSAQEKKKHTERVYYHCLHLKSVPEVDFCFTWYEKNRMRDPDNIMAAQKYIFDGLIMAKVIKNDGWKEIKSITHKFEVGGPGVLIEIMEE
jgi:hypothetical protein